MFGKIKNHFYILSYTIILSLTGCQLKEPAKNHGILFLENRSKQLVLDKSNQNDALSILGQPHSRSITDENTWIYIERTLTKGKYHKLGRHELKTNNTLVLTFDNYGILKNMDLYNKDKIRNVKFSEKNTENKLTKKSFVETFLSSMREKMYGQRK